MSMKTAKGFTVQVALNRGMRWAKLAVQVSKCCRISSHWLDGSPAFVCHTMNANC